MWVLGHLGGYGVARLDCDGIATFAHQAYRLFHRALVAVDGHRRQSGVGSNQFHHRRRRAVHVVHA